MKTKDMKSNVYADIGIRDADEMLMKAQLAVEIEKIIKRRKLTQTTAAQLMDIPQPKLSGLLRGHFRGISEAKLMECLTRLGAKVSIVVKYGNGAKTEHQLAAA